jgi:4-alpha-glucanotransferase
MALDFLFAIHNHQPDGNFGHVFQQAYDDCYHPLLVALAEAPHVKATLHHTGPLLEWIERERPDYLGLLRQLVQRGQVELLGGGFYEPMLAVLPERDARGQILMMSDWLESRFGVKPEGMWLAERVWEPALAKLIADCGIRFTLVDDGHFRAAGLSGTLRGYYVTEKAGTPLAIFPIDKKLRDAIPFLKAWETLDVLHTLEGEAPGAVTYGDDGEKFGVWPHTKEWVWPTPGSEGWLKEFLRLLGERRDRVVTRHFGEYMKSHAPTGRVYLPTASYEEMGEWALPADTQRAYNEVRKSLEARGELERARPFLRGGIWQAFLAKYPEANIMHKKMVLVSDKLAQAEARAGQPQENAQRELYRAQCNCCYWHGLFGGLYLNYLRDAVYHHLIEAEVQADHLLGRGDGPRVEMRDVDADLRPEVLLTNAALGVYVKPDAGGGVFELDYRPKRFNVANVLGRHPEGYHARLLEAAKSGHKPGEGPVSIHDLTAVKSAGLEDLLIYDRHPRFSFIEHFFGGDTTLGNVARGSYAEEGDFAAAPFEVMSTTGSSVLLRRQGHVSGRALTVEKTISIDHARLACSYRLTAPGAPFSVFFAPELNLTLLAGDAPDRYYRAARELSKDERKLASRGESEGPLELVNEWDRFLIRVSATPAGTTWRYPLDTASQSEGGFERTYQGSVLLPIWPQVALGDGKWFEAAVTIELESF